ncbi:MAG: hypothetical protein ABIG89_05205 [Candidatus Woesearchaeota archaeon]
MLDEKKIKEIRQRINNYLNDNIIRTKSKKEFVEFFLRNADKSLNSANALFDLSTNKEIQEKTGYLDFDGFLWVVNASYYSMFYMARALLENEGIKIKSDLSVHSITFDVLVHFFYLTGKLQKELVQYFAEAKEDATELLGKQKANELIEEYFFEKQKRATFTYDSGIVVIKAKAKTSLERATKFNEEIKQIILKE